MGKIDFNQIKDLCNKIGVNCHLIENGVLITEPKDEWEGVEFVDRNTKIHPICKITRIENENVWYYNQNSENVFSPKNCIKPSTEQAYVDQLKAKAFELYGEIKEGDRFTDWDKNNFCIATLGFQYRKKYDALWFGGWLIYLQGKWAKKIEKVTVECISDSHPKGNLYYFKMTSKNRIGSGEFLASKLEEYLNSDQK